MEKDLKELTQLKTLITEWAVLHSKLEKRLSSFPPKVIGETVVDIMELAEKMNAHVKELISVNELSEVESNVLANRLKDIPGYYLRSNSGLE